jgi:hypothetical protein
MAQAAAARCSLTLTTRYAAGRETPGLTTPATSRMSTGTCCGRWPARGRSSKSTPRSRCIPWSSPGGGRKAVRPLPSPAMPTTRPRWRQASLRPRRWPRRPGSPPAATRTGPGVGTRSRRRHRAQMIGRPPVTRAASKAPAADSRARLVQRLDGMPLAIELAVGPSTSRKGVPALERDAHLLKMCYMNIAECNFLLGYSGGGIVDADPLGCVALPDLFIRIDTPPSTPRLPADAIRSDAHWSGC